MIGGSTLFASVWGGVGHASPLGGRSLIRPDASRRSMSSRKRSVNYRVNANFGCMAAFVAAVCLVASALTRSSHYLLFILLVWAVLAVCWAVARLYIFGWRTRRDTNEQEERFRRWFNPRTRRTDDI